MTECPPVTQSGFAQTGFWRKGDGPVRGSHATEGVSDVFCSEIRDMPLLL